jgi:hypothetical protein
MLKPQFCKKYLNEYTKEDIPQLVDELKSTTSTRNTMGGAMYWNILNDEACAIGNRLTELGMARPEVAKIIGEDNFHRF